MNKRIKNIVAFLCIVMLLVATVSCDKTQNSIQKSQHNGRTVITWWSFPSFSQEKDTDAVGTYEKKIIEAFEEKNPNVKVKLKMLDFTSGSEKIEKALGDNSMGDVLFDAPGRIISYGKRGKLVKLDSMFTSEFCADVGNSKLINACKSKNTAYMYPISSSPFYMAFNKKMLEDAGVLDLVREGWTTQDFTKVLEALHKKKYVPGSVFYGDTGGDQGTRAFLCNLYDGSITDKRLKEYKVNEESGLRALQYMQDCVSKGLLTDGCYKNGSAEIADFANGQAAFTLLWGASQQRSNQSLLKTNGIETIEVPFPSEDGVPELEYLVNGFCVFDHGDAKREEASKKLIQFICDDSIWGKKNVIQTGCIPVRRSFGNLYREERMQKIAYWTQYYTTYYNTIDGYTQMREAWLKLLGNVLREDKTVKKAADDFVKMSENAMKEQ